MNQRYPPPLTRRPFAALDAAQRLEIQRRSGMHSPNAEIRTENDAFEVRDDVPIEDACDTSVRLIRMALAQLDVLSVDRNLNKLHREALQGVACLVRLACGTIGLVQTAICDDATYQEARRT
jgi:hypothetical protein